MEKIIHILKRKEPNFHTITPNADLTEALNKMCCEDADHLVVMNDEGNFLGVISEHDITTKALMMKKPVEDLKVKDVMDNKLPMATINDTVESCMKLLRQHQARHIAVFENFSFRGVVTASDFIDEAVKKRDEIFDTDEEVY
ncbi:MAG: CBS domain-containing protein [Terrimonas sp.]|nr:CBS domain-containing protein [Terrimonas sp.]